MQLSIIAAMDLVGGIGINNKLPWGKNVPKDMEHFKKLTSGHTIIMERKTFESFNGRLLSNRRHIVITRNSDFTFPDVKAYTSVEKAIEANQHSNDEIFVIGGAEIYKLMLPYVNKMYITLIRHQFMADTFFPEPSYLEWEFTESIQVPADDSNQYEMIFFTLEKTR